MKKMKEIFRRLLSSNLFLKVFSLVLAFFIWLVIVFATDDKYNRTLENVPVTYTQTETLSQQNLSVISIEPQTVNVEVVGTRYVVSSLTPQNLKVSLQLNSIVNAGTQSVALVGATDSSEYTIKSITPMQANVRVDRLDTKIMDVQANISGINLADGYIKEAEIVSPDRVTLTGPATDLSRVAHAIVNIDVNKTLSSNETVSGSIILRDSDGNDINNENITMDYDAADVTIPVLKKKKVPVSIQFLHEPPNFPLEELEYSFSNDTIEIAGPARLIDSYDTISLGYVDFRQLDIGTREVFDVKLPSGFVNVNNIQSISVSFHTENFDSRSFDIPEIELVNIPAGYEVTVNPGSLPLRNVKVVGPRDTLESMAADDLIAQVDLSGQERELATGQIRLPVTVFAPAKGLVWATGSYVTIVDITEK